MRTRLCADVLLRKESVMNKHLSASTARIIRHNRFDATSSGHCTSCQNGRIVRHAPRCWPQMANYSGTWATAVASQHLIRQRSATEQMRSNSLNSSPRHRCPWRIIARLTYSPLTVAPFRSCWPLTAAITIRGLDGPPLPRSATARRAERLTERIPRHGFASLRDRAASGWQPHGKCGTHD